MSHVSIVTQRRPFRIARTDANTGALTAIATDNVAQSSTPPANATGRIVVPGAMNYLKVVPLFSALNTSQELRVFGWSFVQGLDRWIPHFIVKVTPSLLNTTGYSINGTTLYGVNTLTITNGDGKVFSEGIAANDSNAMLLLDTVGSDFVELVFAQAGGVGSAVNAFVGEV